MPTRENVPSHKPQRTVSHSPPPIAYQPFNQNYSYPPHPNYPPVDTREYPFSGNYYYFPTPQEFSDVKELHDLLLC